MLSHVFGAVDKTSSSFSAHGKIGNFIFIIHHHFSVMFNPTKSVCMLVSKSRSKRSRLGTEDSYFTLDGTRLSFVDKCMH